MDLSNMKADEEMSKTDFQHDNDKLSMTLMGNLDVYVSARDGSGECVVVRVPLSVLEQMVEKMRGSL